MKKVHGRKFHMVAGNEVPKRYLKNHILLVHEVIHQCEKLVGVVRFLARKFIEKLN